MNPQLKTVLLTLLTLSVLTIAIIELSGVSRTAIFNKFSSSTVVYNDSGRADLKAHNAFVDSVAALPATHIAFESRDFNFGKIKEGETVIHTYTFLNTGENPLIISSAIPSCGCTIPSFSKKPIAPGKKGQIQVAFNSAGQKGMVHKDIIVVSNADPSKISLSFDAEITSN